MVGFGVRISNMVRDRVKLGFMAWDRGLRLVIRVKV